MIAPVPLQSGHAPPSPRETRAPQTEHVAVRSHVRWRLGRLTSCLTCASACVADDGAHCGLTHTPEGCPGDRPLDSGWPHREQLTTRGNAAPVAKGDPTAVAALILVFSPHVPQLIDTPHRLNEPAMNYYEL